VNPYPISRRQAVAHLALLFGGTLVGGNMFAGGKTVVGKTVKLGFTPAETALLDEIGETIIPATDIPGAKAVGIGAFMAMMVDECYDDAQHAMFRSGLAAIDVRARQQFGHPFERCSGTERTALLNELDREDRRILPDAGKPAHYFRMFRQLTLLGYFTSEIGVTQALRWTEVPGSYDGDAPYSPGDRAWFKPPARSV